MTLGDFVNLMNEEQRKSLAALSVIEDVLLAEDVNMALDLIQKYKREHVLARDLARDALENCVRRGSNDR